MTDTNTFEAPELYPPTISESGESIRDAEGPKVACIEAVVESMFKDISYIRTEATSEKHPNVIPEISSAFSDTNTKLTELLDSLKIFIETGTETINNPSNIQKMEQEKTVLNNTISCIKRELRPPNITPEAQHFLGVLLSMYQVLEQTNNGVNRVFKHVQALNHQHLSLPTNSLIK